MGLLDSLLQEKTFFCGNSCEEGEQLGMVFRLFVLLFQLVDLFLSVLEAASRLLRGWCGGGGEAKEETNSTPALIVCAGIIYYLFTSACPGACGRGMWLRDMDLTDWGRTVS